MPRKIPLVASVLLLIAGAAFWLVSTSRAATETPEYRVVRADGAFEIRDYPALTIATAPMDGEGMDSSFGKLFRFITGTNESAEKIAMTAPVLIDTANERKTMSFIMPKQTVEKGVPKPSGESVKLGSLPAMRYSVLRFQGGRSAANEQAAIEKLKARLVTEKLKGNSPPVFAYYDPPWTPTFLRRNEVMIRIDSE